MQYLVTYTVAVEAESEDEAIARADEGKGGGHWEARTAQGPEPGSREFALESALVRLLVGLGEPCPEGFECYPYEGLYGDAIDEAVEALDMHGHDASGNCLP